MSGWRLIALMCVVALIIIAPTWYKAVLTDDALEASEQVARTYEVEAGANALAMNIRDREAASLALVGGIDSTIVRERMRNSGEQIGQQFDRLLAITRDMPEQQVKLGMLQATVNQRQAMFERILASDDIAQRRLLAGRLLDEMPIRDQINALVAAQRDQLAVREARARESDRLLDWARWVTMAVQLALLLALIWLLHSNFRHNARMQSSLATSNERAMAVLQTVRDPIVVLDGNQEVMQVNNAFATKYGTGTTDIPGGTRLESIGNGAWDNDELQQRLREVQANGRELWDFEFEQTLGDGSTRTMLLNARRMSLPDSRGEATLLTLSDISARKASEREISELARQLEGKVEQVSEVNKELEAFSYSVSHDLRAPLRHIAGFTEKLGTRLGEDADEQTRHYLTTIRTSAQRMAALIDDLLVYSRLGRSAMRLQAVDQQSVVEEIRSMLDSNAMAEDPDREIRWEIDPLPILIADENMLRQVWLNVLGNAVKYSAPSKPSIIQVRHARLDDGSHEFKVTDNGVGFDMAYAGKLFGVFQRMHRASEFPGTGIGLASTRRVLLRHGGQIDAQSELNKGTTMRFVLPAMLDRPGGSAAAPPPSTGASNP